MDDQKSKSYEKAKRSLRKLGEEGDANVKYIVGMTFAEGDLVP